MKGFLNARRAAEHCGFEPAPARDADGRRNPARRDPQMRAFYEWARRTHVPKHYRGRVLLFLEGDLDRAIGRLTQDEQLRQQSRLDAMAALAVLHAHQDAGVH